MPRLTERVVDRSKPRKTKYEISCSVVVGFLLRVLPSGKKSYYVRVRAAGGKERRVRLGGTTELSFDEAQKMAVERLVGLPEAPVRVRGRSRRERDPEPVDECPRFGEFAERFLREHAAVRLKPHTVKDYRQMIVRYLMPAFGSMRLDSIDTVDVTRFHASLVKTPSTANANLQLMSSIYSRAIAWGVLDRHFTPPSRGVPRFPRRRRERFLGPRERAQLERFLAKAVERKPNERGHLSWHGVAAIRLLAMTGMRRDEVLDLTWDMVDERHRCFRLPDSKTGQKVVPVSGDALELVRECRRVWEVCKHNPKPRYVVYSRVGKRIFSSSLTTTWCKRIRDRIPGFEGVRLHDLRHSAASDALMAGVPLAVVGKILGHRRPETTARYAHIADPVVSDAVESMSRSIRHSARTGKRLKGKG